ncbi:MAG: tetratricopeptide repeat protein [Polyangiaceae bacterium]
MSGWYIVLIGLSASCASTGAPPVTHTTRERPVSSAAACGDEETARSIVIADWPAPLRAELEAAMSRGRVFLRATCSEVALVRSCSLPGRYEEAPVAGASREEWSVRETDAASKLLLRGAKLARAIDGGGTIAFAARDESMRTIGVPYAATAVVTEDEIGKECEGATHVVVRVHDGELALFERTTNDPLPLAWTEPVSQGFSPLVRAHHVPFQLDVVPIQRRRVVAPRATSTPLADPTSSAAESDQASRCELGFAEECTLAAKASSSEAERLLERGCKLGDAAGCERLGDTLLSSSRDQARAINLLERACFARDPYACTKAASALTAAGPSRDPKRAWPLFWQGCREGDARACQQGAALVAKGDGVEKDDTKANEMLERACSVGEGFRKSCYELGRRVASGQGGPPDIKRASELYFAGCPPEGSDEPVEEGNHACSRIAAIYETGDGVKRDFDRGMTLHLNACRRTGDKRSCLAAGNYLEKKSKGRGLALYQDVCKRFQLKEACQRAH